MRYVLAPILLLCCVTVHFAQSEKPRLRDMTATQITEGLLSQDAGAKDRAATELKAVSAETAEKMGAELLRYGVRDCQTVLKAVSGADSANAAIVALCALESREYDVRAAGLDVFSRVSPSIAAEAVRKGLNAKRAESLLKLMDDGEYMKGFCEALTPGATGPAEDALRLVVFLDAKLGVRGFCILLRNCSTLMLGAESGKDESEQTAEQAANLRRRAAQVFEAIWIGDPAKQFNYIANSPFAEREKAIAKIRGLLESFEQREVAYAEGKFKGLRYGDYLLEQALNGDGTAESKAAGCLRLQWWRGDEVAISGESYAEAVDRINAMGRRPKTQLMIDLRKWWVEHRTRTE